MDRRRHRINRKHNVVNQKNPFRDVKKSVQLVKDYYVLLPFFFFYLGFIYIQGMTSIIMPSRIKESSSFSDLIEPNYAKNAFNNFFTTIEGMISSFQSGNLPFSVEFYFINGITFFSKFMLSLVLALFLFYIVHSLCLHIFHTKLLNRLINSFDGENKRIDIGEKTINLIVISLVCLIYFSFVKPYLFISILDYRDSYGSTPFPFSGYPINGNYREIVVPYLKIAAYTASIFSFLCLFFILRNLIKRVPILIKTTFISVVLIILTYYPIISDKLLKLFVINPFTTEILFNIYFVFLYIIIFMLLIGFNIKKKQIGIIKTALPFFYIIIVFITMTFNIYYLATTNQVVKMLSLYNGDETAIIAKLNVDTQQKSSEGNINKSAKDKLYIKVDIGKDYFIGVNLETLSLDVIPNKSIKSIELSQQFFADERLVMYTSKNRKKFDNEQVSAAKIIDRYYKNKTFSVDDMHSLISKELYENKSVGLLQKEWEINRGFNERKATDFLDYRIYVIDPQVGSDYVDIRVDEFWEDSERSVDYVVDKSTNLITNIKIKENPTLEATYPSILEIAELYHELFQED